LPKNAKHSFRTNISLSSEIGPMDPNAQNNSALSANTPSTSNNMETTETSLNNEQPLPNTTPPQNMLWSLFSTKTTPPKTETTPSTQPLKDPNDYAKEFVNITIKDWLRFTFTVCFFIPELSTSYLFTVDLTKSGRIPNLVKYPTQWLCMHQDPTQSILFDFISTNGNTIKISAKTPQITRKQDFNVTINAYKANKDAYTPPNHPTDALIIPFNMAIELDTDEENNINNNNSPADTSTENILTLIDDTNTVTVQQQQHNSSQHPQITNKKGKATALNNIYTHQPDLSNYNQGASSSKSNQTAILAYNNSDTSKHTRPSYS
jgi:hypothetical protein